MRIAWNKGIIEYKKCKVCENQIRKWRIYCSKECMLIGRDNVANFGKWAKKGVKPWNTGLKGIYSKEYIMKLRQAKLDNPTNFWLNQVRPDMGKENHWNWKGGITAENMVLRLSLKSRMWRRQIFKRDNYKCIVCDKQGYLQADHKMPWSLYPKLRFETSNGQTLCKDCHLIKTSLDRKLFNNFREVKS